MAYQDGRITMGMSGAGREFSFLKKKETKNFFQFSVVAVEVYVSTRLQ
jgi:hypothetical protein